MYKEPKLPHVLCGLSFCEACHFVRPIPVHVISKNRHFGSHFNFLFKTFIKDFLKLFEDRSVFYLHFLMYQYPVLQR